VCADGCFTQKRDQPVKRTKEQGNQVPTTAVRDPPHRHPESVFVSEAELKAMEDYVDILRPPKRSSEKPRALAIQSDLVEDGMRVPASVLDACNDSFTAADERRKKASTKQFADTGLMVLVCRHDIVLFIANMTSAGERQYYVFALLNKLFSHLPPTVTIGLLYDIACTTERSCRKWGMLEEYLHRITFAISVFHAYGHQWPCQIVYHPRKCVGFGLSDGEGCERFWHAISSLIAINRVSGVSTDLDMTDNKLTKIL
jgi:hypothetical protein